MGLPLDQLTMPAQTPAPDEIIPVLDVGPYLAGRPGARERLAADLREACERIGFYFIAGHGIAQGVVDAVFEQNARFHALPLERKLEIKIDENVVGYLPMQGGLSRSARLTKITKPNLNESFFIRNELAPDDPDLLARRLLRVPNKWPRDLPGFREALLAYFNAMQRLAHAMLPVYATALDLPPDHFDAPFSKDRSTLRVAHYPPAEVTDDQFGSAPHTDGGFVTMLAQARVPGLEVYSRTGKWIAAPAIEGTFLVNSGDLLAIWTNDRFRSTPHRVINRSGTDRYSIPFFFNPNPEARIECLPTCTGPDNPPRHPPTTYHDYYVRTRFQYAAPAKEEGERAAS